MHLAQSIFYTAGFPSGSAVENPPAMQEPREIQVRSLGPEDPLEEEMATHSGILAWRIPWTEEPGGLQSIGSQRVRDDWNDSAHTNTCVLYRLFSKCGFQDFSINISYHLGTCSKHRFPGVPRIYWIRNPRMRAWQFEFIKFIRKFWKFWTTNNFCIQQVWKNNCLLRETQAPVSPQKRD